jgi:hypothetical protein
MLLFNVIVVCKNAKISTESESLIGKIKGLSSYYNLMKFREMEVALNNDTKLDHRLIIIDENNNALNLAHFIKELGGGMTLIIRYSALACDVCLTEKIKLINNYYMPKVKKSNVVIFVSGYNARNVKALKQSISLDIPVYRVENIGVSFEEKYNNLFVFTIDNELTVRNFFLPEKTTPELSKNYYKMICDKYHNHNV